MEACFATYDEDTIGVLQRDAEARTRPGRRPRCTGCVRQRCERMAIGNNVPLSSGPSDAGNPSLTDEAVDFLERQLRRMAFSLHDGPVQSLSAAEAMLGRASKSRSAASMRSEIAAAEGLVAHALFEMRDIMCELRPTALDAASLEDVLEDYLCDVNETPGPPIRLTLTGSGEGLSPRARMAVFRIVQESVTNARAHSAAQRIEIDVEIDANEVTCRVTDDGVGFDAEELRGSEDGTHWGLRGMRERALLAGGTCVVETAPGQGTSVCAVIPKDVAWM